MHFPGLDILHQADCNTHMPFLFREDGRLGLLFTSDYERTGTWKSYITFEDNPDINRVNTGLVSEFSECNPYITQEGDDYVYRCVNYYAGTTSIKIGLIVCSGKDCQNLSPCRSVRSPGFFSAYTDAEYTCLNNSNTGILIDRGDTHRFIPSHHAGGKIRWYRIMRYGASHFMMSCECIHGRRTYAFNFDTNELKRVVTSKGEDVYKSHIFEEKLIHARAIGGARRLEITDYKLLENDIAFIPLSASSSEESILSYEFYFDGVAGIDKPGNPLSEAEQMKLVADANATEGLTPLLGDDGREIPVDGGNRVMQFGKSMVRWAKSGFENVSKAEFERRAAICDTCPFWDPKALGGMGRCNECGCAGIKRKLKTETCPKGKW